uniref:CUB domain-containing protein n=1 Tax=Branchiostoma floridae TaxID=7739 RepID=C3Y8X6_BRAFL|eukprot:XP_002607022.1 hypothetical protein BRAFLDRAFT_93596 [Branchiostoma floridae]
MSGDLTITSPSYPSPYPPDKLCVWHVTATASKIVVITFPAFNVRCRGDFVAVFDGGAGSTKLIESFCRVQDGRGLRTTSNEMTVVFKSNAQLKSYTKGAPGEAMHAREIRHRTRTRTRVWSTLMMTNLTRVHCFP